MNITERVCAVVAAVFFLMAVTSGEVAPWKMLFQMHRKWTGSYNYNNIPYACHLYVHHINMADAGKAMVTFKADGVRMDVNVFSKDHEVVTFKKQTSYVNSDRFLKSDPFEIEVVFRKVGAIWTIIGNITQPKGKGFQNVNMHGMSAPRDDQTPTMALEKDRSLTLGLTIGIPVTLAFILIITGLAIGYWAIKKGYIRHVPRSYKNFRNPRAETPAVSFEPTEPNNVHI